MFISHTCSWISKLPQYVSALLYTWSCSCSSRSPERRSACMTRGSRTLTQLPSMWSRCTWFSTWPTWFRNISPRGKRRGKKRCSRRSWLISWLISCLIGRGAPQRISMILWRVRSLPGIKSRRALKSAMFHCQKSKLGKMSYQKLARPKWNSKKTKNKS